MQSENRVCLPNQLSSFCTALNLPQTPLFGTDGIRGKAGGLLTPQLAMQVGFWAGQVLQSVVPEKGPVILGQDSRNSSDMLAMALATGLTSAGLEVWQLGLCPTPCVAYLSKVTSAIGGVMISASHNPPEDNGIKFFSGDGTKLSSQLQQQIETTLRQADDNQPHFSGWGKHYNRPTLVEKYVDSLQNSLGNLNLQGMRIVLDLAWGAACNLAPQVFEQMGAQVICINEQPSGDRINVDCGATHLNNLQDAVKKYGADLGFAFDGDADRAMAVDSQGRVVNGDYILFLWGQSLKASQQLPSDLIVATVMANLGFERAWQDLGGKMLRTSVGDQHVQAEMWRTGAMLGGEQSGHIICHHYGCTGDGLQTGLHIAALVRQSGVSLADLVDNSFQTYPQLLRNVRVEDRHARLNWHECEILRGEIEQAKNAMADDGRVLVRASGTEPVIRVMVEAVSADLAQHWTSELVSAVERYVAC